MVIKEIYIRNKKYYHYDTFTDKNQVHIMAKVLKKKYKLNYFILTTNTRTLGFVHKTHHLYTSKKIRVTL